MHRVHGDPGAGELARPLLRERHLGALRPRVGLDAVVLRLGRLERVDVELLQVHPARGDGDHPSGRRLEQRPQLADEQELGEDLRRERRLVALVGDVVLVAEGAGVQHEHVEAVVRGRVAVGEGARLGERGEVDDVGLGVRDLRLGPLRLLRIAPDHTHARALAGEQLRRHAAEPRGRARDDRGLAVEPQLLEWRPLVEAAARLVTDPREAADDARFEHGVGRAAERHGRSAARMPAAAFLPVRLKRSCMIGSRIRPTPLNSSTAS